MAASTGLASNDRPMKVEDAIRQVEASLLAS